MPLMEYRCEDCSREFEVLVGVSSEGDSNLCPNCGSGKVEKLFSTFSARASAPTPGPCGPACPPMGPCGAGSCPSFN